MVNKSKYCGSCGNVNPADNNFCNQCGKPFPTIELSTKPTSKPSQNVESTIRKNPESKPKPTPSPKSLQGDIKVTPEYRGLQEKLIQLNRLGGTLDVICKDNFVRFVRKKGSYKLIIDLGVFEDEEDTVIRIKELGYSEADGRFKKSLTVVDLGQVIYTALEEAKMLFETVFNVPKPIELLYDESFDVPPATKLGASKGNNLQRDKMPNQKQAISEKKESLPNGCIITLVIVSLMLIIGFCNRDKSEEKKENTVELTSNDMKFEAYLISQNLIKEKLKSPSTADFPSQYESCDVNTSDSTYTVTSYVDSQNSFGAQIRTNYQVILKFTGHNWEPILAELDE